MTRAGTLPSGKAGIPQAELWKRQTLCGGWKGGSLYREEEDEATDNGKCSQHGGGPMQREGHLTRQKGP